MEDTVSQAAMSPLGLTREIKSKATELGFDLVGVCRAVPPPHHDAYAAWIESGRHGTMRYLEEHLVLKRDPKLLLPGAQSVLAVGLNYAQPNAHEPGTPRIARYALGRDYHKVLRSKLKTLERYMSSMAPESRCRACVDSAPIMERDFAQLAGLGWFGKNTMLINSRRGSWFFLGLLLTTAELVPDEPAVGSCGTCTKCIDACPTGAIVFEEGRWQVDARNCVSYLTIESREEIEPGLAARLDGWTFGCDVCQEVCPFNAPRASQPLRAALTREPDFLSRRDWPNLQRLSQIDEGEWDSLTRGSPVRRAGLEGLRRNARACLSCQQRDPHRRPAG